MKNIPVYDSNNAPEASRGLLDQVEQKFGFVPHILGMMAESPSLLEGYVTLQGIFDKSDFTAPERHLILLAVSYENACHFCVAAHSKTGKGAGLDPAAIEAVRTGQPIDDPKLEALRRFAQTVTVQRGDLDRQAVADFLAAGYSERQVLDVILGIAVKVMTNYFDAVTDVPLNEQLADERWDPETRKRAA